MGNIVKNLAVLGSTGSIGQQTLEVVRAFPQRFRIVALAAARNFELLAEQAGEFKPSFIYCQDRQAFARRSTQGEFLTPEEMACHPEVDTVVVAISGVAGLMPTIAAVRAGKQVALANKESLVMAGEIITKEAARNRARILPVDSEPSAIWQCLNGENQRPVRLILTASGGPFRNLSPAQLEKVTAEQALKHPSWHMGPKVTTDSATLMNKGLEVIEAHWLFDMPFDSIRVLVHPQSIVHSLVEFEDGSVKAQLGYPDMRLPIQYALSYPQRLPNPELPRLDWDSLGELNFEPPDPVRFPCLRLAGEAGRRGGTYPSVLCAADEAAVALFLAGKIRFIEIAHLVEQVLAQHQNVARPSLEEILAADDWAREKVSQLSAGANPC
jgi:1-deoxy-D-xylulose-5-phosphate reductoisomerase